jgi:hypothetical protein
VGVAVGVDVPVAVGVNVDVLVAVAVPAPPDTVTEPEVIEGCTVMIGACVLVSCAAVKVRLLVPAATACRVTCATVPVPLGPATLPKLKPPNVTLPPVLSMVGPSGTTERPVLLKKAPSMALCTWTTAGSKVTVKSNAPRSTTLSTTTSSTKVSPGFTVLEDGLKRMTSPATAADDDTTAAACGDAWTATVSNDKIRTTSMIARESFLMTDPFTRIIAHTLTPKQVESLHTPIFVVVTHYGYNALLRRRPLWNLWHPENVSYMSL